MLPLPTKIPLFSFESDLIEESFLLKFQYNKREDAWFMDILNANTEEELRSGIKIVVNMNLLNTFRDLSKSPQGNFAAFNTRSKYVDPIFETFGSDVQILYKEFE